MRSQSGWNMYIFREGRSEKKTAELVEGLGGSLRILRSVHGDIDALLDALLRAGELECAATDAGSNSAAVLQKMTDGLASALVKADQDGFAEVEETGSMLDELGRLELPQSVMVSPPEGFAFYALHPLSYVDVLQALGKKSQNVAVVGIRSIGTTLSAVVQAGFASMGLGVQRITVRPTGHPYNRVTEFNTEQRAWICERGNAHFVVVDEGPGMSGSSFLSVGDALLVAGVERDRITFICSRVPDPSSLTARDGETRWQSFQTVYVPANRRLPAGADEFIAGGIWRARVFKNERDWPASWTQMEKLKFLSRSGDRLLKFEGFGRFGNAVYARSQTVGDGGFGPSPIAAEAGFGIYPMVQGESLLEGDLSSEVISRIAQYCAFRKAEFRCEQPSPKEMETMLRFNFEEEFGFEAQASLEIKHPVIADGRMLPHKWLRTRDGELLKVDNASHGDDHFFPGPTDIAWDLAGTIVEWNMTDAARDAFLNYYHQESGDDPRGRLPGYLLAYSVFRMGYCKMAMEAMRDSSEQARLAAGYLHYRQVAAAVHERRAVRGEGLRLVQKQNPSPEPPTKQLA